MKRTLLLSVILVAGAAGAAKSHKVSQKDKQFSVPTLSVAVGESLVISNEDEVMHHVFSVSDGYAFDVAQPPGSENTLTFESPGVVDLRCAIHPQMHLQVTVQ